MKYYRPSGGVVADFSETFSSEKIVKEKRGWKEAYRRGRRRKPGCSRTKSKVVLARLHGSNSGRKARL